MKNKRKGLILVTLLLLVCVAVGFAVSAETEERTDAMTAIEAAFAEYKIGETKKAAKDDYVSEAPEVTTYYDYNAHGVAVPDYKGTQLVLYVVNTLTERIGTKTDVDIIRGMLDRGYIVAVVDYLNHKDAISPNVDWSTQIQRTNVLKGNYFTDNTYIPEGSYLDNYVVPAGYDVSLYLPFWETDKHGAEGSLERIVENWNTDFRKTNQDVVIPWIDENGAKKSTQNDFNGNEPEWYSDAAGKTVDNENGTYTKVKWTLAKEIFDCVDPEGNELDLTLYMHIVYPTFTEDAPIEKAPILADANSSGHLTTAVTSADIRPIVNAGMFNGYVGVVYDYLFFPMARNEHYGYYDGNKSNGGYTYDQMNYALHLYNDKRINTAAMRYLRYLALSEPDKYSFDTDAIGVYGNSKGSWITFLGNPELKNYTSTDTSLTTSELEELMDARINAYISRRQFPGHADETRYQVGEENCQTKSITKNGITIDKGELQPWLTYEGKEILANANLLYPCCGPMTEDMVEGHAPMFASMNLQDNYNSAYASSNDRAILMKNMDIPSLAVIADVGHMYTFGPDQITGIDTYKAMFDFMGYYLKHDAVKVLYVMPLAGTENIETDSSFTVKFTGPVDISEIAKISVKDNAGTKYEGAWSSAYGKTEWTFTPDTQLLGNAEITLTVPSGIAADNGKGMESDYVAKYSTKNEGSASVVTVKGDNGIYFVCPAPDMNNASDVFLRFRVNNPAANVAELYTVSGFSMEDPDASSIGDLVGSVNLRGEGYYEIDVTEEIGNASEETVFLLKAQKAASVISGEYLSSVKKGRDVTLTANTTAPDGTDATKIVVGVSKQYAAQNHYYYQYPTELFTNNQLIKSTAITKDDTGRRFIITLRIYDTTTRLVNVRLNGATALAYGTIDVEGSIYNFYTSAGEWVEYSFEYVVTETDFGDVSEQIKKLTLNIQPDGANESPVYVSNLTVTEIVTDIDVVENECYLVKSYDENNAYKAPVSENPFSIGENGYVTLNAALSAATDGAVITMNKNYRLTSLDSFTGYEKLASLTVDMQGYRIYLDNELPLINAYASSNTKETTVIFKNGAVSVNNSSLIKATGTTSGNGKVFNIAFENAYIYTAVGAWITDFMLDSSSSSAASDINVSLIDTVINVDTKRLTKNPLTVFSGINGTPDVDYTVKGGKFVTDSFVRMTFVEDYRALTLVADAGGEYTKLHTSASSFILKGIAAGRSDGYGIYTLEASDGIRAVYSTVLNPLATPYGIISDAYENIELYPVIIFNKSGDFCKGYDQLSGALNYFGTYSEGDEWYIYVRRDYTYSRKFDNLSNGNGTLYVDFGGHTVTLAKVSDTDNKSAVMLYNADAKNNGDITVNTYNGTLLLNSAGAVRILGWHTANYDTSDIKSFNFGFENIKFALAEGATTSNLITYNYERSGSSAAPAYNAMTFTDCVFDITGATKQIKLFTVGNYNGGQVLSGAYNVNGCEIIADNAANLDVYDLVANTGSSINFNKNSNGEYITVTVPEGSTLASETYVSANEGLMELTELETVNGKTTYTLTKADVSLITPYGTLPAEYASVESYPWVVFKKNADDTYTCIGGGTKFTTLVMSLATETAGDGAVIYLRNDYNMQTAANAAGVTYIGRLNGSVTVDLGENTVTMGNGGSADAFLKCEPYANGYVTTLTVKNGNIVCGPDPLVRFAAVKATTSSPTRTPAAYFDADDTNPQTFNIIFDGVIIDAGTAITKDFSITNSYSTASSKVNANVKLKDCDINITNTSVSISLFKTLASKTVEIIAPQCVIEGGTISIASVAKVAWESYLHTIGATATLKFKKDTNGNYTKLTLSASDMPQTNRFTDAENASITDLGFFKDSKTGASLYRVSELNLSTAYGAVPEEYAAMPWVVFDANKNFIKATYLFTTDAAKAAVSAGSGSIILLRRDYHLNDDLHGNKYLSNINGSITVDLGGHTLSVGNKAASGRDAFIRCEVVAAGYVTNITVKNGTILTGDNPIVRFAAVKSRVPSDYASVAPTNPHEFNVILDGIKISYDPNASTHEYHILYTYSDIAAITPGSNNLIIKDCDIDFNGFTEENTKLFASHNRIPANVVIKGGSISYGKDTSITWQALNTGNDSSLKLDKNGNGEYTYLVLQKGKSAPTAAFTTPNGEYKYVKLSEDSGYVTYRLMPSDIGKTKVKSNIVFYSDFIYNVYVLKTDNTESIVLGGITYDVSGLPTEEIDGNIYYVLSYDVAAAEAAENVTLAVNLLYGDDKYSGSWTLNVIGYAEKVLGGSYGEITDTLMLDMVNYIKSAYVYFESVGLVSEEELAVAEKRINAILGSDYDKSVTVDGEAVNNSQNGALADAKLEIGAEISFVFTPENSSYADKYVFKQGESVLESKVVSDGENTVIIVKTYAYRVRDAITYRADIDDNTVYEGSYNLKAYYDYLTSTESVDALGVIEALWKYSVSAAAYRESVIN
ncbi:MAG: hypothetical protein E7673_01320 [Ruminococcaceae bacterium]|nr:hypothetical protein [Oscillospiraceae bacterium]